MASSELFDRVVVATDHPDVLEAAQRFGAATEITDPAHSSGTDRVAEIARRAAYRGFDIVANVQGDEPFVSREQLERSLGAVRAGEWPIGTVATQLENAGDWSDPNVVKVVRDDAGGALLFSRAAIPFPRDAPPTFGSTLYLRHVGVYAYTREALLRWVALPEHPLEQIEKLEQLRPMAAGLRIGVAVVEATEAGVDTAEDAARAERRLRAEHPLNFVSK